MPALQADPEAQRQQDASQPLLRTSGSERVDSEFEADHWSRRASRVLYTSVCHLGASLLFGLVTAMCLKTFGHAIALALIILFIAFLVLAYYGYVNMNWASLGTSTPSTIHVRPGGTINIQVTDGSVGLKEVSKAFTDIFTWTISWGLMSVLGFGLGFYFGWEM